MKLNKTEFLQRIGLSSGSREVFDDKESVLLTGAAADPDSGLLISLSSLTEFDANGLPSKAKIKYWRHLPYAAARSQDQNLISVKAKPSRGKDNIDVEQIWVQSTCVYDSCRDKSDDPETRKNFNRVLEGINRLNACLRNKEPVENLAKILNEAHFNELTGENLTIVGLGGDSEFQVNGLKKEGGFSFLLSPAFTKAATQGQALALNNVDKDMLKTVLGFSFNGFEPDKDFSNSRKVTATDPQSGVAYEAEVKLKEYADGKISVCISSDVLDAPSENLEAQSIPELAKLIFKKGRGEAYNLKEAKFLGQSVDVADTQTLLPLIGMVQQLNADLAKHKYPAFMDAIARYDLLDRVDPLPPPPPLEAGGEMLYVSLHGTGFEKVIEDFGDQIGIADLFLQRGVKKDGSVSTVGVAVDFPFASGGPNSNYDGAIPNYMQFWDDIKIFKITHDHFDHSDGLPYYAKAGMLREKEVYCTKEVKWALKNKMDALGVPPRLRPKINIVKDETPFAVHDDEGNVRFRIQACPNGASHSARCTPYKIVGCYNEHLNAATTVYGDANKLSAHGETFYQQGIEFLKTMQGVDAERVDDLLEKQGGRPFLTAYHDPTAIHYEGVSPEEVEVEQNLTRVYSWFPDKAILADAISTNDIEYTVITNAAHNTGRNITAVGRNAELRVSSKNLFGMLIDKDLRDIRLDPFEETKKADNLIPQDVLDIYFDFLDHFEIKDEEIKVSQAHIDEILHDMEFDRNDLDSVTDAYEGAKLLAESEAHRDLIKKRRDAARLQAVKDYKMQCGMDPLKHEKNVNLYMLESLFKHDAVVFENDFNGYLKHKAIEDGKEEASIQASRTSLLGKSLRAAVGNLLIFVTGTQGNSAERFSTMQKFADFMSLLDADEKVRPTGYKLKADDTIAVITQPPIPGNEESQERMIRDLVRNRGITVVAAFMDGYKIYNPKEYKDKVLKDLQKDGTGYNVDAEGSIRVYGQPIHYHGHGFRENVRGLICSVKALFQEAHHIPGFDSLNIFRDLLQENGDLHSGAEGKDFQVMRLNAHAKKMEEKYSKVAELNPSYVLVKLFRKFGQFFGGWLQLTPTTLLRRDGTHRADGLMARVSGYGVYKKKTARASWEEASNPYKPKPDYRSSQIGPSIVSRGSGGRNRSRPVFSNPIPDLPEAA